MKDHKRITSVLAVSCMMLVLLISTTPAYGFAFIRQCNSNGTYQASRTVRTCVDPDTGLLVGYQLFTGFSWTTKDNVVHSFPLGTISNSSQGYGADGGVLCGPDSIATGSAVALDGSGFSITVTGFDQARIFDGNGVEVFVSPAINFSDPNAGSNC